MNAADAESRLEAADRPEGVDLASHFEHLGPLLVERCPLCGDPLLGLSGRENCPTCSSRARTRSLSPLVEAVVAPLIGGEAILDKPLLAFALVRPERKQLEAVFKSFKSVSLYGEYGAGHETNVDVRDLSRYAADSFSGVFGSLLFDYFAEHERALAECFRVTAPGGIILTHIAPYRLLDGNQEPRLGKQAIMPRSGYFEYVPKDKGLPNAKVGRNWFIDAMRRVGFQAARVAVNDKASGLALDWFVGVKPMQAERGHQSGLIVTDCPICGDPLHSLSGPETCPTCSSRARTRSLSPIVAAVIAPTVAGTSVAEKPLLSFAMVRPERKQLEGVFKRFKSASLFGHYGTDHETGVDVRDLSRYADAGFSGVFGIGLFDYFAEHEQALAECFRVIAPGGMLFTHIIPQRLLDGDEPPRVDRIIRPRPGSYEYVPADQGLPSAKVGRSWFVEAMRRAGFQAKHLVVEDKASGRRLDWFLGVKLSRQPAGQ